jgi:hypothetical protein
MILVNAMFAKPVGVFIIKIPEMLWVVFPSTKNKSYCAVALLSHVMAIGRYPLVLWSLVKALVTAPLEKLLKRLALRLK